LETQEKRPHTKNLANKTIKKTKKKHQIGIARAKNNQKVKQMQSK
jgi:hypothetical protein